MGSTFVEFRGRGFEASDATIEIWLLHSVEAIDELPAPEWLQEAREEWHLQATAAFGFSVVPGLDAIVLSSARRDVVLQLCSTAMKRLRAYGPIISRDQLNAIWQGAPDNMFTEGARTDFMKLLREELAPKENDARFPRP